MFAGDVCNLPATGSSTFVVFAGLFLLLAGVIVSRWGRSSTGRLSVVIAPLVFLGGLALAPSIFDLCVSTSTTTTTVPSTSLAEALTPTFGSTTATADGFTVVITNYNTSFTWAGTATASGAVVITGSGNTGLATVTGVAAGTSSTATITMTRTGYAGGTADVTATSFVAMSMVRVGNAGNATNSGFYPNYGAVSYAYKIGTYDVTGSQYTAFLNAVASTDTYGLYNASMGSDVRVAQISRSGTTGTYTYAVIDSTGNRPISFVSWWDSARFANWMSNGQPSGSQTSTTTENGAYDVNGATSGNAVSANATNPNTGSAPTFRIPLENEWYKAAYYSPNYGGSGVSGYYVYATQSDSAPGTTIGSSANQANYNSAIVRATDVGAFSGSGSFYGTFDQTGNVYQWTDRDGTSDPYRSYRGGNWGSSSSSVSARFTAVTDPSSESFGRGFRLASPVTTTLTPVFGTTTATADGFTVVISKYDSSYVWAGTATASGTVTISGTGLVTVTGIAPATNSTATITTTKSNTVGGSADVTETSVPAMFFA